MAHSIVYYVKCSYDDKLSIYKSHSGKDCLKWFRDELIIWKDKIEEMFRNKKPMTALTDTQQINFYTATICSICRKLLALSEIRVADYCHLTDKLYI